MSIIYHHHPQDKLSQVEEIAQGLRGLAAPRGLGFKGKMLET